MKSILIFLFLFNSTGVIAQNSINTVSKRIDTIHSSILNEDRYIWVHIPDKAPGASRYPVAVADAKDKTMDINQNQK